MVVGAAVGAGLAVDRQASDDVGGVWVGVVAGVHDADRSALGRAGIQVESVALAAAAWLVKTSSAGAEEARTRLTRDRVASRHAHRAAGTAPSGSAAPNAQR